MRLRDLGLSLIHPFYNDKARLRYHIANWKQYSPEVMRSLQIILVDDGSKVPLIDWADFKSLDLKNLHIYRITKDLKWNTPGALNLGITQAPTDWVTIMDSDCLFEPAFIEKLMDFKPDPGVVYHYHRDRVTNSPHLKTVKVGQFLPCAMLMHKDAFYTVGGFDEDFTGENSGGYGFFDTDFSHRVKLKMRRDVVPDVVVLEYMEDIVGPNVQTVTRVRNKWKTNKKLWYDKINGIVPRNRELLRFQWRKEL